MILFVFEGKEREPQLYRAIEKLFFPKEPDAIVCSFGNNIYELYKQITRLGDGADIVSVLREQLEGQEDNPLKDITTSSAFAEIYLFLDAEAPIKNGLILHRKSNFFLFWLQQLWIF